MLYEEQIACAKPKTKEPSLRLHTARVGSADPDGKFPYDPAADHRNRVIRVSFSPDADNPQVSLAWVEAG